MSNMAAKELQATLDKRRDELSELEYTLYLENMLLMAQQQNAELLHQKEAILQQARCWAGEAKAQRSTVNEVGSLLGGVPDWGPIAKKVEAKLRQDAELVEALIKSLSTLKELPESGVEFAIEIIEQAINNYEKGKI